MEWLSTIADGDAVIIREEATEGPRFVVHSRRSPQLACRTYAGAEALARGYAERARVNAWYWDGRALQLIGNGDHAVSAPTRHHVGVTSRSKRPTGDES